MFRGAHLPLTPSTLFHRFDLIAIVGWQPRQEPGAPSIGLAHKLASIKVEWAVACALRKPLPERVMGGNAGHANGAAGQPQ
jgi:hypothetical protein